MQYQIGPRPDSFSVVMPTAYGQMLVNRHDTIQANSLFKRGISGDHDEIGLLAQLLKYCPAHPVVLDVGASFGTYSLALARVVGTRGRVYAFEPQRLIFYMLAGSVALNSLTNVYCIHSAIGDRDGTIDVPQYDYSLPLNFGGVELGLEQREPLLQTPSRDLAVADKVPIARIDFLGLQRVDLMKIDVEGMEMEALSGALQTIALTRPILYVEFLKSDANALRERLVGLDYAVLPTGINFLSVPKERQDLLEVARQARSQIAGN